MLETVTRWSFWKEAFWRPAGALVALPYAIYGFFMFIRDEVIEPTNVERWKLVYYVSRIPWYWWLIFTLAIAVGVAMEGSFRVLRKREGQFKEEIDSLSRRIAGFEVRKPRLVLDYQLDRGYDPEANRIIYPHQKHEPLFLRNDGDDTAINIVITSSFSSDGLPVSFFPQQSHLKTHDEMNVHVHAKERIDTNLYGTLLPLVEERIRQGQAVPFWEGIEVTVSCSTYSGGEHERQFRLGAWVRPRGDGVFLAPICVDLVEPEPISATDFPD